MTQLHQYAQAESGWNLEEFVAILNRLLPQFLPHPSASPPTSTSGSTKTPHGVRDTLTPRLVRHYTSQGLVDEPQKQGRSARYGYRHLLQLLLVRRLLREGYSTAVLQPLLQGKDTAELEALLQGGVQLTVVPANPALAFLEQVRQRSTGLAVPSPQSSAQPSAQSSAQPQAPAEPLEPLEILEMPDRSSPARPDLDQLDGDALNCSIDGLEIPESRRIDVETQDPDDPQPQILQRSLWQRIVILPDLEIHLGPNVTLPRSLQEQQNLAAAIVQALAQVQADS